MLFATENPLMTAPFFKNYSRESGKILPITDCYIFYIGNSVGKLTFELVIFIGSNIMKRDRFVPGTKRNGGQAWSRKRS